MRYTHPWMVIFALAALLATTGCEQARELLAGSPEWQAHMVSAASGRGGPQSPRQPLEPGERVEATHGTRKTLALSGGTELHLEPGAVVALGRGASPSARVERGRVSVNASDAPFTLELVGRAALQIQGRAHVVRHGELAEVTLQGGQGTLRVGTLFGASSERELLRAYPVSVQADGTLVELPALGLEDVFDRGSEEAPLFESRARVGELQVEGIDGLSYKRRLSSERQRLTISVKFQGPVAHTDIEEVYTNPHDAAIDATYAFALPPGAQLTNGVLYDVLGLRHLGLVVALGGGPWS